MELFKPKWKSKAPEKRREWIENAKTDKTKDIDILNLLAKSDEIIEIRELAISKITDTDTLKQIISEELNLSAKLVALQSFLSKTDIKSKETQDFLIDLVTIERNSEIRSIAIKNISSDKIPALFVSTLEQQSFWDEIAKRSNLNMDWCVESLNGFDDEMTFFEDWFPKLLENKKLCIDFFKSWLLPRLKNEEKQRDFTFSTICVLQILGLLDFSSMKEIIEERVNVLGVDKIKINTPEYYYKSDIVDRTLSYVMATLLRRSYGHYCKKKNFSTHKLTDNFSLFSGNATEEFALIWQIVKLPEMFEDLGGVSNAINDVRSGQLQEKTGFDSEGFLKYMKSIPDEGTIEFQKLKEIVIKNNEKVREQINERYSNYY